MTRPPISPRNSGFIPLEPMSSIDEATNHQAGLSASNSHNGNNDHVVNIPLTPIRSNASATGARKEGQVIDRPDLQRRDSADTENGIFHKHMGRRRGRTAQTGGDASLVDDEGALTTMGKLYEKVLNFSIVTRYLLYIIPLSSCFVTVILIGLFVAPHATIGAGDNTHGVRIVWFFVWVCFLAWCQNVWISSDSCIVECCLVLPLGFKTCCQGTPYHIPNPGWCSEQQREEIRTRYQSFGSSDFPSWLVDCLSLLLPPCKS